MLLCRISNIYKNQQTGLIQFNIQPQQLGHCGQPPFTFQPCVNLKQVFQRVSLKDEFYFLKHNQYMITSKINIHTYV